MALLSLDCLTLTDTEPRNVIWSAHKAGFNLVSLWTNPPSVYPKQLLTPQMASSCAALMADTGVGVHSIEAFDLVSDEAVVAARPAIEVGARLGGKVLIAFHYANPDRAQVLDTLCLLTEQARQYGLGVNIEPVAMGHTRTLSEARDLIRDAGVDAGILFDTYHFVRVGGNPADIAAIEPSLIRYVQISDGPALAPEADWLTEALGERLYPGEGDFPLVQILRTVPRNTPWGIEAPSLRRVREGAPPEALALEAFAALRHLISQVDGMPPSK